MLRILLCLAALLQLTISYQVPNSQCTDEKGSPTCPNGHMFMLSFNGTEAPCTPPHGGLACTTTCDIVQKQNWEGKTKCTHNRIFSHNGAQGPSCWHWAYPYCAGQRQSPINIDTDLATEAVHLPLEIEVDEESDDPVVVIEKYHNNGHAIQADLTKASSAQTTLTGGPLGKEKYQIVQFHFHFNSKGSGSEHTINNKGYHAEMHIVTFNKKYSCFSVAQQHCDGLAVIGVMLDGGAFTRIKNALGQSAAVSAQYASLFIHYMAKLKYCGSSMPTSGKGTYKFHLKKFLPKGFDTNYYTYQGSLTTPPCSESVRWIVLKNGLHVNTHDIAKLSAVMTGTTHEHGHKMDGNRRPVQDLHGRKVESV